MKITYTNKRQRPLWAQEGGGKGRIE